MGRSCGPTLGLPYRQSKITPEHHAEVGAQFSGLLKGGLRVFTCQLGAVDDSPLVPNRALAVQVYQHRGESIGWPSWVKAISLPHNGMNP